MRQHLVLCCAITALAQVPPEDSRNTYVPNTDTHFRMPSYPTRAAWETRATHLRKQILAAAGLLPLPEKTPLRPIIAGRIENGDYSIEKVAIETMPGYWLGGNLFRPLGKPGKHPAVASPHGHWTYGRLEHQPLASVPARAINLARQGYVVFTYDMVGYTDTLQTPHVFGDTPREQLWSFGPLGLQLWNSIRVVDFLESLPDVDPSRIGATGASGGGTQIFLLAAVDPRVSFAAPVNMISAIMAGGSPCENAPGLRVDATNMEFGAMMAPRPMLMVSATGDWTRNTAREEYPAVQGIYELYSAADKLATAMVDAPHNYNQASREAVYRFFGKQVLQRPDAESIKERGIRLEKLGDMLVWHGRGLPAGALDFPGVRDAWIARAIRQNEAISDTRLLRDRLRTVLAADWPSQVMSSRDGEMLVLSRAGRGDRVSGVVLGKGMPSRLVVHPGGAKAARSDDRVKRWLAAGETLLLIDAFQTGAAKATRDRAHRHFLTFNKSDDAERVQDILTSLAWMQRKGGSHLKVSGFGTAAVWASLAAAVAPVTVDATEAAQFTGSDEEWEKQCFIPGIQRVGGWKAVTALLRAR